MTPGAKRRVVVLGLSITSSWGNGHATTYRGLIREFVKRGHDVIFAERDVPWYAENRDLPSPEFCRLFLYRELSELMDSAILQDADAVIVGSYVPNGIEIGNWVLKTARCPVFFYDIDTPVTLANLERGDLDYLSPDQIARYDGYLSFSGGKTLARLERDFGSPLARSLYCSVDPETYFPEELHPAFDLGYMGTYSEDRQPPLNTLLVEPAQRCADQRFIVAGPQYPSDISWPANVDRVEHLPPSAHRSFYNRQRFTLNITRADMIRAGWSPSVRLFEAAACGVPVISDYWIGIEELFTPGSEILIARSSEDMVGYLTEVQDEERREIGRNARDKVLARHTSAHRAADLESIIESVLARRTVSLR